MPHPMLTGRLQSVFSIIELDFKAPFTARGPPEFLDEIFTVCLKELEKEEDWEWTMWGNDAGAPNKVCIMLGWRQSSPRRDAVAQAAISKLKANDMPDAINSLSPFLTSLPSIHHTQSPDRNEPFPGKIFPFNERHCDIFILEAPSSGPLYESINVEMMALRRDCNSLLPSILCGRDQPFGDMSHAALGVDDCDEMIGPNLGSGKCTFMFLVYWTDPEAMARFKHPVRESIQKYGWKVGGDWWTKEVLERFARLENAGAWVKQGTFKMRDFEAGWPLIWPDVEIAAKDKTGRIEGEGGCRSCCTM